MLFTKRLYYFAYEFVDLLIFLVLWASLWCIYDYMIEKYVGTDRKRVMHANIAIFCVGLIFLFIKHTLIKSPYIS